eukprot:scaffold1284_cov108-Cylindrotheca_fusiformis.AAC.21
MITVRFLAVFLATASTTFDVCGAKTDDKLIERIEEGGPHPETAVRRYLLTEMDIKDEIDGRIAHDARDLVTYFNQSYFDGWVREGEGDCVLIGNPSLERSRGNLTIETEPFEAWLCYDKMWQPPSVYMVDEESFTIGRNCTLTPAVCNMVWNCKYYDFQELCGKETLTDEPMTGGNCIVTAHVFKDGYEAPLRDSACDPDMNFVWANRTAATRAPSAAPTEYRSADLLDIDGIRSARTKRLSFTLSLGYTASLLWWIL